MTVTQAIAVINRRSKTLSKLFGSHSDIYEEFSTNLAEFSFRQNKYGNFLLNADKANKSEYRKLVAWARRIQKTPYAVLKRKSDKLKEELKQDGFFDDMEDETGEFVNMEIYSKWFEQFSTYFESCYDLARREGYDGRDAWQYAADLYDDRTLYVKSWNSLYKKGSFEEYMTKYETEQTEQEYDIDDITGEMTQRPDFYEEV